MSDIAIKVENLSKQYRIGGKKDGSRTFREAILKSLTAPVRWMRGERKNVETFWALDDVSFEIKQGEAVGIIGRNGAGKSTLLKILSRITKPTTGRIELYGRVASLLEVGTGFHSELSGRDNIYLNGAILGMSRSEVARKFDEIVDFSGVEKFLDTPVKHYSSGMYVRLAFAVAAHLEPEILIIDEVLAVGDAEFQKKCLGKMEDVAKTGRTVLFVSHNMGAISSLCNRSVILQNGKFVFDGTVDDAIRNYSGDLLTNKQMEWFGQAGDESASLLHTWVRSLDKDGFLATSTDIEIGVEIEILKPIDGLILGFTLYSPFGYELAYALYDDDKEPPCEIVQPGKLTRKFLIPSNTLAQGSYRIEFDVGIHMRRRIIRSEGELIFNLENVSGLGRRFPLDGIRGKSGIFRPRWLLNE